MNPIVAKVTARMLGTRHVVCDTCHSLIEISDHETEKEKAKMQPGEVLEISCTLCGWVAEEHSS